MIKDLPFQLKHTYLILKKRRYACKCGKRFLEKYCFLASYQRRTVRLSYKIIDLLRNLVNIKSVAVTTNVSVNTVTRLLDTISYTIPSVPECISIDEFKGSQILVSTNVYSLMARNTVFLISYQIELKVI